MEFISDVSIVTMANVSTLVDNYLDDSSEHTPDVNMEGLVEEQGSEQELDVQVPEEQQEEAKEEEIVVREIKKEKQEEEQQEEKEKSPLTEEPNQPSSEVSIEPEEPKQSEEPEKEKEKIEPQQQLEPEPEPEPQQSSEEKPREAPAAPAAPAASVCFSVCFSNIHSISKQRTSLHRRSPRTPACTRTIAAPSHPPRSSAAARQTPARPASPCAHSASPPPR